MERNEIREVVYLGHLHHCQHPNLKITLLLQPPNMQLVYGASDGKKSEEIFLLIMSKIFISVTIFSSVLSTSSIEKLVISLAMASARP